MFEDEHFLKAQALQFWINYLETGDVTVSASDVNGGQINSLSDSQKMLVKRLTLLKEEELKQCSQPQ